MTIQRWAGHLITSRTLEARMAEPRPCPNPTRNVSRDKPVRIDISLMQSHSRILLRPTLPSKGD